MVQKFSDMFSHFDTILACDGRTDGQTHVATVRIALCRASRGKKMDT